MAFVRAQVERTLTSFPHQAKNIRGGKPRVRVLAVLPRSSVAGRGLYFDTAFDPSHKYSTDKLCSSGSLSLYSTVVPFIVCRGCHDIFLLGAVYEVAEQKHAFPRASISTAYHVLT